MYIYVLLKKQVSVQFKAWLGRNIKSDTIFIIQKKKLSCQIKVEMLNKFQ